MAINKVSNATKEALRNKSAFGLPNNPTDRGYTATQIKEAIYKPVIDTADSIVNEIDRVVEETNQAINAIETTGGFISKAVTIPADAWENGTATVSVSGVTANNSVLVSYSETSYQAWKNSGIRGSAQGEGTLTFTCEYDAPTQDITANITYWG